MECVFKGLDTKKCFSHQKCAGVENLVLQMGGSKDFALGFSKYAFRTSLFNKIKDNMFESEYNWMKNPESPILKVKYLIYKLVDKIGCKIIGNPYKIQERFRTIENRVFKMEFLPERYSPMDYCEKAGEGYAFFFYWSALGSGKSKNYAQDLFEYGKKLGTIVTLRDSIKDYDSDKRLGKYNPFHYMSKEEVLPYFQHNIQILQGDIQKLQNSLSMIILKTIPKQNAFEAVFRYAMQSQSFCAKCSRATVINSLKSPATKTAASMLASVLIFFGLSSVCGTAAASGGNRISSILQEADETCCDRCTQNCAESCCESCCDNCAENCTCSCNSCNCSCNN